MKDIILNNGIRMPQIGLGTFLIPKEVLSQTIGKAYELGYRQFDTAWKYHNEKEIAQALKDNKIQRKDVFLTTKISAAALYFGKYKYGRRSILNIPNFRSIKDVIQESIDNLGSEYVDLFLIHYPYPESDKMWRALEDIYHEGRIRAIGVSNFLSPHLDALKDFSDIIPAVNQFEISPLNTQKSLIADCQARGIAVEAMSTFSHFRSVESRAEIIKHPKLNEIADSHGKSVVQVVLRWLLQQNIILIPKTWNFNHLKENISVFDFSLSEDEMRIIDSIDKGRFLNYNPLGQQQGFVCNHLDWDGFIKWNEETGGSLFSRIKNKVFGKY